MRRTPRLFALILAALVGSPTIASRSGSASAVPWVGREGLPLHAASDVAALRARSATAFYNLDYDDASRLLADAERADPADPVTQHSLASEAWLHILFTRGAVLTDDYLGGMSRSQVALRQPPADLAASYQRHITRAEALAEPLIRKRPSDASAWYDYGVIVALRASYTATVEGKVLAALGAARHAYDAHERVLDLDPTRKDAGLVVGTYRYLVGSMPWAMRLMAYVAGFGGDKARGLKMVEEAAAYPGLSQAEARFALVLMYNRERRFGDALRMLADLRQQYPRNRLLWLETGATSLRAGHAAQAERWLTEGIDRLATDTRPRMFGEDAVWYWKRGAARYAQGRDEAAREDLRASLEHQARPWVWARTHLALGRIADLHGERAAALEQYAVAIALADRDNDSATVAAARQFMKTPARTR